MFANITAGLPHVRANRVRALGVTGPKRSPEEFAAYIRAEIPRWAVAVKTAGLQGQAR
jgi:tripartite-type tricarboxylate transporter receptor subunit TctC